MATKPTRRRERLPVLPGPARTDSPPANPTSPGYVPTSEPPYPPDHWPDTPDFARNGEPAADIDDWPYSGDDLAAHEADLERKWERQVHADWCAKTEIEIALSKYGETPWLTRSREKIAELNGLWLALDEDELGPAF